jgi:hypothetical protein
MNCLEIQRQLAESFSYSNLSRNAQRHLESCVECQGAYPTKPVIRDLLFDAWPEIEPDRRLIAMVRQSIDKQMDKSAWGFWRFDWSSIAFAGGVAALFMVLGLPLLWMGSRAVATKPTVAVAQASVRPHVQAAGFAQAAGLASFDSIETAAAKTSTPDVQSAVYRPQIRPGAVVHVIYPFRADRQPKRAVLHY